MRMMQIGQAIQQTRGQNALRQIYSQPDSTDEQGNLKPNALKQVFATDPATGAQIQRNQLAAKQQQMHMQMLTSDQFTKQMEMANTVKTDARLAYEEALSSGLQPDQALEAGQKALSEGIKGMQSSGLYSEEWLKKVNPKFDPNSFSGDQQLYMRWKQIKENAADREQRRKLDTEALEETKKKDAEQQRLAQQKAKADDDNKRLDRERDAARDAEAARSNRAKEEIDRLKIDQPKTPAATALKRFNEDHPNATADDMAKFIRTLAPEKARSPRQIALDRYIEENPKATASDLAEFNRNQKIDPSALIDDDTASKMARQYLTGDTSVMTNIGRGAQSGANIAKVRRSIYEEADRLGLPPEEIAAKVAEFQGIKAGERTLGTRTAQVGMAVSEAKKMAPLALRASETVDRTQFPTLNRLLLAYEKGTGDENVVRFGIATNSLINIYARAISPTGVPTVSDKDHARELLEAAWSKGQFSSGVDQLLQEMNAASQAPGAVRQEFRDAVKGDKAPVSDAAGTVPSKSAYKDANEVRQAFRTGKLTKEDAAKILRDQFGYQ